MFLVGERARPELDLGQTHLEISKAALFLSFLKPDAKEFCDVPAVNAFKIVHMIFSMYVPRILNESISSTNPENRVCNSVRAYSTPPDPGF